VLVPEGTKTDDLLAAVTKAGYSASLRTDESESFSHTRGMGIRVLLSILFTSPVIVLSMWHEIHHQIENFLLQQLESFNLPLPLYSATGWLIIGLSAPVVLLLAWPIHRAAVRNLAHPTMDNLISLGSLTAFAWSIYANATGAGDIYAEVAASVVTFIILGRFLESRAKRKAGSTLAHLLALNPKEVLILRGNEEVQAPISHLRIGDQCIVKPGDRIPTDGIVVDGASSVDNSLLTGESLPVDVKVGSEVIAGSINTSGRLIIEARRVGNDTELSRITTMVLTAQGEKAPIQKLADRISNVFVPIVMLLSVATFSTWYFLGNSIQDSMRAAVALLVIACPCALGLATPVALLVATGKGASNGIVLRKTSSLEIAPRISTVVLDKTGTLTTGVMKVQNVTIPDLGKNSSGISAHQVLMAVLSLENESNHPIAQAISKHLREQGIAKLATKELVESAGQGIAARVDFDGREMPVLIGTPESIRRATVSLHPELESAISAARLRGNSIAVVAVDGIASAVFEVGDTLRSDASSTIAEFHRRSIETWLLTGDNEASAHQIAMEVGIPTKNVIALATPERKISKIKELRAAGEMVLMIGDGINDAAAIAEADLSMALGTGTDTAIASADITLMRAELGTSVSALNLAKNTLRIVRTNLVWAFIYNVIGMPIAALGLLNPMYAGAAMACSSLFVVLNSLRLNRASTLSA
jgi:Cu+-exporting ATPase